MADLLVLPRPAKSSQNGAALSEKLEHTGSTEKENVTSVPQRESCRQVRQSRVRQKKKEQNRPSRAPDRKGGGNQGELESHLGEREGDQSGSMERKR